MAGAEAGALATGLAPALALGEEEEVEVVVPAQPTHKESKLSTTAERLSGAIMGEYLSLNSVLNVLANYF
jgi:hypothetical protein